MNMNFANKAETATHDPFRDLLALMRQAYNAHPNAAVRVDLAEQDPPFPLEEWSIETVSRTKGEYRLGWRYERDSLRSIIVWLEKAA